MENKTNKEKILTELSKTIQIEKNKLYEEKLKLAKEKADKAEKEAKSIIDTMSRKELEDLLLRYINYKK